MNIERHPDWQRWYFEVWDTDGEQQKASGYVMGLSETHATRRLKAWAVSQTFPVNNPQYPPQPIHRSNVRLIVHPDPEALIFGAEEPPI
jgi:hypothetical protein